MRTALLALCMSAVALLPARAQLCLGGSGRGTFGVGASRDDNGTWTGGMSAKVGPMTDISANVARPHPADNGSKSNSFGGRIAYGAARESFGMCVLTGLQLGYAWVINDLGMRRNGRITTASIPVALSLGVKVVSAGPVSVVAFATPQVLLQFHHTMIYDRTDTVTVDEHPTRTGWAGGASLHLGILSATATTYHISGLPGGWSFGGGVRF